MKKNILSIAKTAMKHFFDIDPVITEVFLLQTTAQAQALHYGVRQAFTEGVRQHKTRIISLMHLNGTHNWNAA